MTELDFEFKTACHRTQQAEKRIARQQELVSMLMDKGQPVDEVQASLSTMHHSLNTLRAQRSEMARKLRYRARRKGH